MSESLSKISGKTNWLKMKVKLNGLSVLLKYSALIYRDSVRGLLGGKRPDFDGIARRFSQEAAAMTEYYLDFDYELHGHFPELQAEERGLIISNHPTDEVLWPWLKVVSERFSPNLVAIAKKEFIYDPRTIPPFLGWPAILGGMMVPVDRQNRESAIESIRHGCSSIFGPGDALFIFPEGHRPTPKRIEDAREKFREKYPNDDAEWMKHTPFPKSGGLMEILEAMEGYPLRILNTTVATDESEQSDRLIGSSVRVHGEEVSREELLGNEKDDESREAHLREWLCGEWERKNRMIDEWRK